MPGVTLYAVLPGAVIGELVWSVLAPAIVVGLLLVLILARQIARGGRLPLHDAAALRSQFTFVGPEGEAARLLERIREALHGEGLVECDPVIPDEGYSTVRITRPREGLVVSLGFVDGRWVGFLSRGTLNLEPPPDSPETRRVLGALHDAINRLPGTSALEWHKYEALTRGDDSSADERPFR